MPDIIVSGGLAGLAALSLPLGAVVAVLFRPPARIVAVIMAFGSGALIHAVVTELAVDPEKGDFRLREDSPAAAIGVVPLDPKSVGPR